MNTTKSSNPVRLIAFFLTALLLVCTFGFTADGWHTGNSVDSSGKDDASNDIPKDTNNDNNQSEDTPADNEPDVYVPSFINRLTGLEASEEVASGHHYAFVLDGGLPFYGISSADIFCQIPTEGGSNKYIAFIHEDEQLWKIGSIAKTRGYISNVAKFFGGICISNGNEDEISYNQCDISTSHLDLSLSSKYHYTEFQSQVYTNSDLLKLGFSDNKTSPDLVKNTLPYSFIGYGSDPIIYENPATNVKITESTTNTTEFIYSGEHGKYLICESGLPLIDSMNGSQVSFTNCFVLFADSVIYDNSECSQMVMDTVGNGRGYYFCNGSYTEIKWSSSSDGSMCFTLSDGTQLTINRGNTFISFQKSSLTDKISIE